MKILLLTDNPNISTGMARVGEYIATGLAAAGHKISYIGWYKECEDKKKWPFTLYPCANSTFGKDIFDEVVLRERPDVVLTIGDPWMYDYIADSRSCKTRGLFQWVGYTAVDGESYEGGLPDFWSQSILNMDKVIAYTEYGRQALLKTFPEIEKRLDMIYHGFDEKVYYPFNQQEIVAQKAKLGLSDKFLFLSVARNQGRKNWPEIFKAWRKVMDRGNCPNAYFWPHTYFYDNAGHNIDNIIKAYGLMGNGHIVFSDTIAHHSHPTKLLPENMLNTLYNCADVFLSASGEGFGLPIIEAMGTKTPCIVANESATKELGAEGRALRIKTSVYVTGKYMTERPIPDVDDMVNHIEKLYADAELRKDIAQKAYDFALNHTWAKAIEKWKAYFDKFAHPMLSPFVMEEL